MRARFCSPQIVLCCIKEPQHFRSKLQIKDQKLAFYHFNKLWSTTYEILLFITSSRIGFALTSVLMTLKHLD